MKKGLWLLLSILFLGSCSSDEEQSLGQSSESLLEQISRDPDLNRFSEALQLCDTDLSEPYASVTILAPSNQSLDNYLSDLGLNSFEELKAWIGTDRYQAWLGSHFFPQALRWEHMQVAYVPTLAKNKELEAMHSFAYREKSQLWINGQNLSWQEKNIEIPSGYLHKIEQILPPPTLNTLVRSNGISFSILNRALLRTPNNLAVMLNQDDQLFTLFAPTDQAFDRYFQTLGVSDLTDYLENYGAQSLESLLKKHIVPGAHNTGDLGNQQFNTLLTNQALQIRVYNGMKYLIGQQDSAVINLQNITAYNGKLNTLNDVLK